MSEAIIIKVSANGQAAFWADSNHQDILPAPVFNLGEGVVYDGKQGLETDEITHVYIAQDVEYLQQDKGRYCVHYGIGMNGTYPKTFRSEFELLEWNQATRPPLTIQTILSALAEKNAEKV